MRLIPTILCGAILSFSSYADDISDLFGSTSQAANIECKGNVCHIYLIDEIHGPDAYVQEYKLLASAKPGDTVYLHLAGPGGQGDGLVYLINAINNSQAKVVSVMDGSVASADAVLAVMNKDYIINGDVQILFHNISINGMQNEVCRQEQGSDRGLSKYEKCMEDIPKYVEFYNKTLNKYVYPLLTEEEHRLYDEGHDIIIDGDELKERLNSRK